MKRRFMAVLLGLLMVGQLFPVLAWAAEVVDSGTCGVSTTWVMTDDGTLTISGTGAMKNYNSGQAPWQAGSIQTVVIDHGVTSIGDWAFYHCDNLSSVTIPNSVTSIGRMAFQYCSNLTSVEIPNSVTSIGRYAFQHCIRLESVTIPDSVTSIEEETFNDCTSLTSISIPESVASIGRAAFIGSGLTSVTIPDSVTSIESQAFAFCNQLTEINVSDSNAYFASRDGVLFNAEKTELIQYPNGRSAEAYTIPDGVASIGGSAFSNCDNLTSVIISDGVTSIEDYAFNNCTGLMSVSIPDSVTSIKVEAFNMCNNLTDVYYGGTQAQWETLKENIRENNDPLLNATIHFEGEPPADNIIDSGTCGAEGNEENVRWTLYTDGRLVISGTGDMKGYDYGNVPWFEHTIRTSVIESGVTSVGYGAFNFCESLTSVEIPDSVTSIEMIAFQSCRSLTSVEIPDGVTSIFTAAFNNCISLTSVTIPNSVTSVGNDAFYDCSALTDVYYGGTQAQWETLKGNIGTRNTPLLNANIHYVGGTTTDSDILASGTCGAAGNEENVRWTLYGGGQFVISGTGDMANYSTAGAPWYEYRESIRTAVIEHGVTSVGEWAFDRCNNLEDVTISDSVIIIKAGAFSGCTSLTSATLPNSVTEIRSGAFTGCTSLTSVTIPDSVVSIRNGAFQDCTSLTSVMIPDSVTSIEDGAFAACTRLTEINVSGGNTHFSSTDGVLFNASKTELIQYPAGKSTTTYTIPASVTSIREVAFEGCVNLTSASIPNGVTAIKYRTFQICNNLINVTIPNSIVSIGDWAFNSCTRLTDVYYGGTQAQWETLRENIGTMNEPLLSAIIHYAGTPSGGLAAPTNLRWITERGTRTNANGETVQVYPGSVSFDNTLNTGEVQYELELSEPDGSFDERGHYALTFPSSDRGTIYSDHFSRESLQTGTYRFRVTVENLQDSSIKSEPAYSDVWSYTRPSAQLAVPTGLQMTGSRVTWNAVPGADGYEWEIGYTATANEECMEYDVYNSREGDETSETEGDASWSISEYGAGYYHLRIIAVSDDITTVSNSDWSEEIVVYSDGTTSQPGPTVSPLTVTFYPNGGTGSMSPVTIPAGQSAILPANTFTRDGYVFTGWNTWPDGSGTAYADGASVFARGANAPPAGVNPKYSPNHLYAQWEAVPEGYAILDRIPDMYKYEDQSFRIDGPLSEFVGFTLDGNTLTAGSDYTTSEGSTRINIPASTFQNAGEGTHTIAATFAASDAAGSSVQRITTQSYTVDLSGQTALSISALRDAVQYVPYSATVQTFPHYADLRFKVIDGSLPSDGDWNLDPVTGEITGVPQVAGAVYTFTVGVSHGDGETLAQTVVRIQVKDNTSSNVISETDPGFAVRTAIPSMVEVPEDVKAEFVSEGDFKFFQDFYLDGKKLTRDVDYKAEEGSTRITPFPKTLRALGKGEHTAAATFNVHNHDGTTEQKVSSHNFTIGVQPTPVYSGGGGGGGSRNPSYAINLKQVTGGTVKVSTTSARSGAKITLTLTPNAGYTVKGVTVTGTNVAGDVAVTKEGNQYTFTMPGKQVTVTPSFGLAARRVVATAVEHGKLTVQPTNAVPGTKVTITTLPENGYVAAAFSAWDEKGQYLTVKDNGDGTASFTMTESPVQVGARFELDPGLPVTDIKPTDWFYEDARWAYRRGIMTGVTGTTWVPEDHMSTATAVVTLARLAGADLTAYQTENWTASEENNGNYDWIPNEWYAAEARWAARNGILTEDIFTGREVLPRARLAVMLRRFLTQQGVTPEPPRETQTVFSDAEAVKSFGPEAEEAFRVLHEANVFRGDSTKAMLPGAATKRSHLAATLHRLSEYIIGYWETKATAEAAET